MEWINVKEYLPELGKKVMIAFPASGGGYTVDMGWNVDDGMGNREWWSVGFEIPHDFVTHWMPLPEPPKV